jgi:glutathione S-transferase
MIKIWGRKDSSNVQKVLWCCDELGVQYERVDLGGRFGGNRDPQYLRLNPNGLVPTIQDEGFILWESNAIVRYLVEKYGGGRLLPPSPQGRANAYRWMDWQLTTINPAMVPLFWGLVRTPEEKRDPKAIAEALARATWAWSVLDEHLLGRSFVDEAGFSIGDIPLGVWVHRWFHLPIERPLLANLSAWYERLCARPAYRTHVALPLT